MFGCKEDGISLGYVEKYQYLQKCLLDQITGQRWEAGSLLSDLERHSYHHHDVMATHYLPTLPLKSVKDVSADILEYVQMLMIVLVTCHVWYEVLHNVVDMDQSGMLWLSLYSPGQACTEQYRHFAQQHR